MIRLRELRKQKGVTMKQLGNIFGLAESTISLYETEKRQPDRETLMSFADFFGVTVDYLLGRDSVATDPPAEEEQPVSDRMRRFREATADLDEAEMEIVEMFIQQVKNNRK